MTQTQIIWFLILAAVGCTIVVSRGDIFKPFRDWLNRLSIKHKGWVHDFTIPDPNPYDGVTIDGKTHFMYIEVDIKTILISLNSRMISWSAEKVEGGCRYFAYCKDKHSLLFISGDSSIKSLSANVYERIIYYPFLKWVVSLFECPQCLGVWVGMLWYLIYPFTITGIFLFDMLCNGFVVSLISYLYFKIYSFLEKK